jgi:hypothetical protein
MPKTHTSSKRHESHPYERETRETRQTRSGRNWRPALERINEILSQILIKDYKIVGPRTDRLDIMEQELDEFARIVTVGENVKTTEDISLGTLNKLGYQADQVAGETNSILSRLIYKRLCGN